MSRRTKIACGRPSPTSSETAATDDAAVGPVRVSSERRRNLAGGALILAVPATPACAADMERLDASVAAGRACASSRAGTGLPSPDALWSARVLRSAEPGGGGESVLCIDGPHGSSLHRDHRSSDGGHGLRIVRCRWTADSRFLVYSAWSSGGHAVLSAPTFAVSVRDGREVEVVTADLTPEDPAFRLRGDVVLTPAWSMRAQRERPLAFDLTRYTPVKVTLYPPHRWLSATRR